MSSIDFCSNFSLTHSLTHSMLLLWTLCSYLVWNLAMQCNVEKLMERCDRLLFVYYVCRCIVIGGMERYIRIRLDLSLTLFIISLVSHRSHTEMQQAWAWVLTLPNFRLPVFLFLHIRTQNTNTLRGVRIDWLSRTFVYYGNKRNWCWLLVNSDEWLVIFFWTVYFYYINFYYCTRYQLLCDYNSSSSSDTSSEEG